MTRKKDKSVSDLAIYRERKRLREYNRQVKDANDRLHPEMVITDKTYYYAEQLDTLELVVKRRDQLYVVHIYYELDTETMCSQLWTLQEFIDRTLDGEPDGTETDT